MHSPIILIVDDDQANRELLVTLLSYEGYRTMEAPDGPAALALIRTTPPDLIIADILMPMMDGYELVRQLRSSQEIASIPVIFHTATYLEPEAILLAAACGVRHVLVKPSEPEVILRTVRGELEMRTIGSSQATSGDFDERHLRIVSNKLLETVADLRIANSKLEVLIRQLREAHSDLTLAYDMTLEGWVRALDMRDHETAGHSRRVTEMTVRLARGIGMEGDELMAVKRGALLHDIGKLAIPDRILLKAGALDEEEWKLMRQHPVHARTMLEPIAFLRPALAIPCYHHEKWNGTGYPHGLRERNIPLAARLFSVVDVWDALCSERPYRSAWPRSKAEKHMIEESGRHFEPEIVARFMNDEELRRTEPGPAI